MQLYQNPLDEHLLWDYIQTEQWDKALELIEWYYDRTNPDGFDDPRGVRNVNNLTTKSEFHETTELPNKILRSQKTYKTLLYVLGFVYTFFGFLSYNAGSINVMIIPAILFPVVPIAFYNLIKKTTEINLTVEHLEFRKSTKKPILWANILAIYYYRRGTGGINIGAGHQAAHLIFIWKKDAVKPESYNLNYLENEPEDVAWLINQHWEKKNEIKQAI